MYRTYGLHVNGKATALGAHFWIPSASALNSKGHTSVSLEVLQQNEQAITFFKRRAFVETTERPDYDPVLKRKINKYVMEKRL